MTLIRTNMAFSQLRLIDPRNAIGTLLFTLILSGFSAPRCGATVYQSNGSVANVQALQNAALPGDTITLPAGTFAWTSRLEITKGITLQGQTTITGTPGNPVITDATIIQDNTPRSGSGMGIIRAQITPSQSFRLTGVTFTAGSSTTYASIDGAIQLVSYGSSPCTSMRIDHCHFAGLYQAKDIGISGWIYGVADHNVFNCRPSGSSFYITHASWGGISQVNGNGSWAAYPYYGTEKFFFIEDNAIIGSGTNTTSGGIDCMQGGRYVARHNAFTNARPGGHGTEGGPQRGQRVREVYDNTFYWTITPASMQRSGTSLYHDNVYTGLRGDDVHTHLALFREFGASGVGGGLWGSADGTSPWDINDTEGNGTYVEGHAPFLFDSGTDTSSVQSQGVIQDSTKSWTPNRWVGYSITNTNPAAACFKKGSFVISNTSNTITYSFYSQTDRGPLLIFNAGDTYEIHRVLTQLDQNGRGRGNQVTGAPQPINSVRGWPWWTHEALEPCFSWNNVHTPTNHSLGFASGSPTTIVNREYHNLGAGFFPHDATPLIVSSTYKAALNGVNYVGTFVYPHPLVIAQPPPTTPTPSATACSLLQQRLDRLQRRQQRLKRLHIPHRKLNRRLQRVQLQLQNCL